MRKATNSSHSCRCFMSAKCIGINKSVVIASQSITVVFHRIAFVLRNAKKIPRFKTLVVCGVFNHIATLYVQGTALFKNSHMMVEYCTHNFKNKITGFHPLSLTDQLVHR